MFKSGICVLVAMGAFALIDAISNEQYIGNAVHKDYPGKCYYKDAKQAIPVNTSYKPTTECAEVYCRDDYVIRITTCPRYMVGDGCTVNFKKGAPYPYCCADIDCPKAH